MKTYILLAIAVIACGAIYLLSRTWSRAERPVADVPIQAIAQAPSRRTEVFWAEQAEPVQQSITEHEINNWHYHPDSVSKSMLWELLDDQTQDDGVRNEIMNILRNRTGTRSELAEHCLVRAADVHETVRMRAFFIQHLGMVFALDEPSDQRRSIGEWLSACTNNGGDPLALRRESLLALRVDPHGSYRDQVHKTIDRILRGDPAWNGFSDLAIRMAADMGLKEFLKDIIPYANSTNVLIRTQAERAIAKLSIPNAATPK